MRQQRIIKSHCLILKFEFNAYVYCYFLNDFEICNNTFDKLLGNSGLVKVITWLCVISQRKLFDMSFR